jgi:hypothetical protein
MPADTSPSASMSDLICPGIRTIEIWSNYVEINFHLPPNIAKGLYMNWSTGRPSYLALP